MPSCNLLSIFTPLMGFALLVAATPIPSESSHHDSHNISTTSVPESAIPYPSDYASTILFHHNVHRANHSASALTYSPILAGYSSSLIQSCASLSSSSVPTTNSSYSTNTYAFYSSNIKDDSNASEQTARAISTWYNNELDTYVAKTGGMSTNPVDTSGILHFSQIVWKDTTQVGCAALQCSEGTGLNPDDVWPTAWAVVCAYSTAGNCLGNACADDGFLGNVGSPLGLDPLSYEPWAL